jgi:threonine/homoserine/homoserine lactone efflux protein
VNSLLPLIVATAILVMIPGPNVALIVANSLRYGFRMGVHTVLGTTVGVGLQLALVVVGLAAIVEVAAEALLWIKWAGVAYLVYLGIRTWREPADDLREIEAAPAMFGRGCAIAILNPKTLLFNAAFIPQFGGTADATASEMVPRRAVPWRCPLGSVREFGGALSCALCSDAKSPDRCLSYSSRGRAGPVQPVILQTG